VSCQTQISDMDRARQAHEAGDDTGYLGAVGRKQASGGGVREDLERGGVQLVDTTDKFSASVRYAASGGVRLGRCPALPTRRK
jgi:hypothetical protein